MLFMWLRLTSFCSRCASCSVSNVTNPYPLLTPARSTIILVDFTFPYAENTCNSSDSVVSPLMSSSQQEQRRMHRTDSNTETTILISTYGVSNHNTCSTMSAFCSCQTAMLYVKKNAAYLIPPTKIRLGINVPYLGAAAKGASICPAAFGVAIILSNSLWWFSIVLPYSQLFSIAVL